MAASLVARLRARLNRGDSWLTYDVGRLLARDGLDDAAIEQLCASYPGGQVLEPVNYNAPGQVVVAGDSAALQWLEQNAKSAGARMTVRLPVSVPSHCSLMQGAAAQLAVRLAQAPFQTPVIPVLHNLDAAVHPEPHALRAALREQLYQPVRWTQTIQALAAQGAAVYLECGPGKVLAGLNKRILDRGTPTFALEDPAALAQALEKIKE